jgi:hypothetical protein
MQTIFKKIFLKTNFFFNKLQSEFEKRNFKPYGINY